MEVNIKNGCVNDLHRWRFMQFPTCGLFCGISRDMRVEDNAQRGVINYHKRL